MSLGAQPGWQSLLSQSLLHTGPARAGSVFSASLISHTSRAWLASRPGHGWPATELAALLPAAGTEAATESVSSRRPEQCC